MGARSVQRLPDGQCINISLIGRVALSVRENSVADQDLGPLARVALAYLVLQRHRPVTRDELAESLWGERVPPTWRSALRGIISRLRIFLKASGLDGTVLTNVSGCYELRLTGPVVVDVERAKEAVGEARIALGAGDAARARRAAECAVELCQGQFLAGSTGIWVEQQQDLCVELHVQALELLADAAASQGDAATALDASEQAVAIRPWRESAYQRVMDAHSLAGNRAEALRTHERCRRVLKEELGVSPSPRTEAAYAALLDVSATADRPGAKAPPPTNLRAVSTSFVGRHALITEITRLVGRRKLVTLVGTGGVGKSRLAVQVARLMAARYREGSWIVDLADLTDPGLLALQALSALRLPEGPGRAPEDSLVQQLKGRELLLIFDNCEGLTSACSTLADRLLQVSPGLTILATSREPLGAARETTLTVPTMPSPGPGEGSSTQDLLRFDATRLFVERALVAAPDVEVESVAGAIAAICRGLDGIPLAIELAAARVRTVAIPELARRLDDRFRLLVCPRRSGPRRHQTMREAVDWSHEALSEPEQRLFSELSVFAGGFTLGAAESVSLGSPSDVLDTLSGLVDQSLVEAQQRPGTVRYRLLETLRQYASERLAASGHETLLRQRHLAWVLGLARSAGAQLEGLDQAQALAVLEAEHENLRAALDWAAANDRATGLEITVAIWRYFEIRGHLSEGRALLEAFAAGENRPSPFYGQALNAAGVLAHHQRDLGGARALLQASLRFFQELGDRRGAAVVLHNLANVDVGEGDLNAAQSHFEENLAIARSLTDRAMLAASLLNLGVVNQLLFVSGKVDRAEGAERARQLYEESLATYRELGDRKGIGLALENLGAVAPYQGDMTVARACLEQSLALRRKLGDRIGIAGAARFLGQLALRSGELEGARALHEESLRIERELGNRLLIAHDLSSLADVAEAEGDLAQAYTLLEESLALYSEISDTLATQQILARLHEIAPVLQSE